MFSPIYQEINAIYTAYTKKYFVFRAWITKDLGNGKVQVFFVDWGNEAIKDVRDLKRLKPIHWTLRPQLVLFRIGMISYYIHVGLWKEITIIVGYFLLH